jgi:hypothetical protein
MDDYYGGVVPAAIQLMMGALPDMRAAADWPRVVRLLLKMALVMYTGSAMRLDAVTSKPSVDLIRATLADARGSKDTAAAAVATLISVEGLADVNGVPLALYTLLEEGLGSKAARFLQLLDDLVFVDTVLFVRRPQLLRRPAADPYAESCGRASVPVVRVGTGSEGTRALDRRYPFEFSGQPWAAGGGPAEALSAPRMCSLLQFVAVCEMYARGYDEDAIVARIGASTEHADCERLLEEELRAGHATLMHPLFLVHNDTDVEESATPRQSPLIFHPQCLVGLHDPMFSDPCLDTHTIATRVAAGCTPYESKWYGVSRGYAHILHKHRVNPGDALNFKDLPTTIHRAPQPDPLLAQPAARRVAHVFTDIDMDG